MTAVPEAHPKTKPLLQRPAVMRLLILALLAEVGYAVLNISTMPVYLQFDRGFGASVTGLVVAAFLLSEAVFKSPMGALADRVGRKTMVVLGPSLTIFTALATLVVPFDWGTSEVLALIGLRLVDGLGAAMLWPAMFALMSDSVEDHERQQAMSLLNMCYLLGVALALPVGGIVNDLFGRFLADFSGARSPSLYLAALLFAGVSLTAYLRIASDRRAPQSPRYRRRLEPARALDGGARHPRVPSAGRRDLHGDRLSHDDYQGVCRRAVSNERVEISAR
ncbi:MAG: Arabinose efflux permease [Armatimonadetes bacterium OLB18]|nr:MAG: Arabinose efflux permease [Armatimonadetes bacterium OLB18]